MINENAGQVTHTWKTGLGLKETLISVVLKKVFQGRLFIWRVGCGVSPVSCVERSEDSLMDSVLSFRHMGSGMDLRLPALETTSTFTH